MVCPALKTNGQWMILALVKGHLDLPVRSTGLDNQTIFDAQSSVLHCLFDPSCLVPGYPLQELVVVLQSYELMLGQLCLSSEVI